MGGTSFDVSLIVDGNPSVSTETALEGSAGPDVDRRHPRDRRRRRLARLARSRRACASARAAPAPTPGPACYGRGGTEPTVTDANLLLGRLDPGYFLGGAMTLDLPPRGEAVGSGRRAARSRATRRWRKGCSTSSTPRWPTRSARSPSAAASTRATSRWSPIGGAGPMHAVALAEELDIAEVIVPWAPGAFSAWGMLQTDIRHDLTRTLYAALAETPSDADRGDLCRLGRAAAAVSGRGGGAGRADALRLHRRHALRRARSTSSTWSSRVKSRSTLPRSSGLSSVPRRITTFATATRRQALRSRSSTCGSSRSALFPDASRASARRSEAASRGAPSGRLRRRRPSTRRSSGAARCRLARLRRAGNRRRGDGDDGRPAGLARTRR